MLVWNHVGCGPFVEHRYKCVAPQRLDCTWKVCLKGFELVGGHLTERNFWCHCVDCVNCSGFQDFVIDTDQRSHVLAEWQFYQFYNVSELMCVKFWRFGVGGSKSVLLFSSVGGSNVGSMSIAYTGLLLLISRWMRGSGTKSDWDKQSAPKSLNQAREQVRV